MEEYVLFAFDVELNIVEAGYPITSEIYEMLVHQVMKGDPGDGSRIKGFLVDKTLTLELSDKLDYSEADKTIFINSPEARYDETTETIII